MCVCVRHAARVSPRHGAPAIASLRVVLCCVRCAVYVGFVPFRSSLSLVPPHSSSIERVCGHGQFVVSLYACEAKRNVPVSSLSNRVVSGVVLVHSSFALQWRSSRPPQAAWGHWPCTRSRLSRYGCLFGWRWLINGSILNFILSWSLTTISYCYVMIVSSYVFDM